MNKVMVLAVHPDDETLGCGGTLLKHKEQGDEIHWVIVTSAKSFPGMTKAELEERAQVIKKVSELFKFDSVTELELPTIELDSLDKKDIVKVISNVISSVQPNILYLPFAYDVHSDHRVVFECAYSCTKSFRYSFIKKIYMMETLSETEYAPSLQVTSFVPNVFSDITSYIDKKTQAMSLYKTEIGEHPFPRSLDSIKAQAMFRGSSCGVYYAEAFMLLKEMN
jgi:LmbE family N-acetylglucosaminyl deacetylase